MPIRATRKSSERLLSEAGEIRKARARYDVITRKLAAEKINAGDLTESEIKAVAEAFPAWSGNSVAYELDDLVTYEGGLYKCITAHTSQEVNYQPGVANSLWSLEVDYTPVTWVDGDTYAMGEAVTHLGQTWISLAWGNGTEPGSSRFWEVK